MRHTHTYIKSSDFLVFDSYTEGEVGVARPIYEKSRIVRPESDAREQVTRKDQSQEPLKSQERPKRVSRENDWLLDANTFTFALEEAARS